MSALCSTILMCESVEMLLPEWLLEWGWFQKTKKYEIYLVKMSVFAMSKLKTDSEWMWYTWYHSQTKLKSVGK